LWPFTGSRIDGQKESDAQRYKLPALVILSLVTRQSTGWGHSFVVPFFLYFFCCQDNWVGFCSWLMAHGSGLRTQGRWLLTRPTLDLIRPIENAFRSRLDSQFKFNAQGNGNESKTNTHANCALSRGYSLWGPNLGHFEPGIGHELWKKSIGKRPKGPLQGLSVQIKIELVRIFNFQLPFVRLSLHLKVPNVREIRNLPF